MVWAAEVSADALAEVWTRVEVDWSTECVKRTYWTSVVASTLVVVSVLDTKLVEVDR